MPRIFDENPNFRFSLSQVAYSICYGQIKSRNGDSLSLETVELPPEYVRQYSLFRLLSLSFINLVRSVFILARVIARRAHAHFCSFRPTCGNCFCSHSLLYALYHDPCVETLHASSNTLNSLFIHDRLTRFGFKSLDHDFSMGDWDVFKKIQYQPQ